MKMIFAEPEGVADIQGKPRFGASGLIHLGQARGLPEGIRALCAVPQPDGSWMLYLMRVDADFSWSIWRSRTIDGFQYENAQRVSQSGPKCPDGHAWLSHAAMAWNSRDNELLCTKWSRSEIGHAMWCLASDTGAEWKPLADRPAFADHDASGLMWDQRTERFIDYQTTYQTWEKPFEDNIGKDKRRVLHIRTSPDGITWEPPDDVGFSQPRMPDEALITPDADDPDELEFYLFQVFPHNGRYVGMMLKYAASPGRANTYWRTTKHAPQLGCEWWISDDGIRWRRPWRDVFASGDAPAPGVIFHAPMTIGGWHLWVYGDGNVYGLPEDRIFFAASLAMAGFTTQPVEVSGNEKRPIILNASFGYDGRPERGMQGQGYIMAELLDERGAVIKGYERERCIIHDTGILERQRRFGKIPLSWDGDIAAGLAGKKLRLRLAFRDARIYGIEQA